MLAINIVCTNLTHNEICKIWIYRSRLIRACLTESAIFAHAAGASIALYSYTRVRFISVITTQLVTYRAIESDIDFNRRAYCHGRYEKKTIKKQDDER